MGWKSSTSFIIRKLWLTAAVLLVGFALLISAVRLSLPYLDNYRTQIAVQISERLGQPVLIGALDATWSGRGPALILRDVQISDNNGENIVQIEVGDFRIGLDFWNSVLQRQWLFNHFELAEMVVEVHYQGSAGGDFGSGQEMLERLLFTQLSHFSVRDSRFTLYLGDQTPRSIEIERLSWRRSAAQRQAVGLFRIPDITANSLDFILDLQGDSLSQLSGNLYVAAQSLDISPWLQTLTEPSTLKRAEFNLQGWLDFSNGQFGDGQLHFAENVLEWGDGEQRNRLITPATAWTLFPQEDGWVLNSAPMQVQLNDQEWPLQQVTWQFSQGEHLWNINEVELIDFTPLWNLFGSAGQVLAGWSSGLQVGGHLNTLQVRYNAEQAWQFYALGEQLSWLPHAGVPGISGLQIELWSDLQGGQFTLAGEQLALSSPATYHDEKVLSEVLVQGGWAQQNGNWQLAINDATFSLPGATIQQQLHLAGSTHQPIEVDWLITGGSTGMDVLDVVTLLPLQLGEDLGSYLTSSLIDGEVDSLSMIWRGPLANFPYQHGEGVMQAQATINDLDYRFQPDWPAVIGTRAELVFHGDQLDIHATGGELAGIPLQRVSAEIRDISRAERHLHISADVASGGEQLQQLFQHSPLADSVGSALAQVYPLTPITGAFTLDIPLQDSSNIIAEGYVNLAGTDVMIAPVGLTINDATGQLRFRNGELSVAIPTAQVFGLPLAIDLTGTPQEEYQLSADITGNWSAEVIQAQHGNIPLLHHLYGALSWQADFDLTLGGADSYRYQWLMQLNLDDAALTLPAPFAKDGSQQAAATVQVAGTAAELTVAAEMPNAARLRAAMVPGSGGFHALELQVGDSGFPVGTRPENGFRIYAGLSEAELSEWLPVITELVSSANAAARSATAAEGETETVQWVPALQRVDATIDELTWFGQRFHNTQVGGRSSGDGWLLDVNADNGRVRLDWSTVGNGQLTIAADFLELQAQEKAENDVLNAAIPERAVASESSQPADYEWLDSLPPIIFSCRICRYDGREFGEVLMRLEPARAGEQLQQFEVRKGSTVLQANGGWAEREGQLHSALTGSFRSNNVGSYLHELGYNSIVRDSNANFTFDLGWQGALHEWNKETLQGELVWAFGAGYLRDVSDGGARLFSLLSLDSVLRKLTLDFRDIFARGMFYSSFGGTLTIDNGMVRTNNTRMNGAAGDMSVRGHTNLLDDSLQYQLSYVPKVTSSLPVLLAFMVNPPSGIAALVLDRVLHDAQVISRLEYEISGTISEPLVTEVKRDSREVELPEMGDDVLPRELPQNTEAVREN